MMLAKSILAALQNISSKSIAILTFSGYTHLANQLYSHFVCDVIIHPLPNFKSGLANIQLLKLTHWGRMTHICVSNFTIIGSDNGLAPGRRQAITWTNVRILLIGHLGTNFSEMLIEIHTFSFKKIHLKMSSGKWRPFCLGLNVLRHGWHGWGITPQVYVSMICYLSTKVISEIMSIGEKKPKADKDACYHAKSGSRFLCVKDFT